MATKKRQKQLRNKKLKQKVAEKKKPYINQPSDPTKSTVTCNRDVWLRGILDRDPAVWVAVVDFLFFFENHHYKMFGVDTIKELIEFVELTYTALSTDGFNPDPKTAVNMVQMAHLFHHLVAVTAYATNDGCLQDVLLQQNNLIKLMFLQNARCKYQIDQSKLFDTPPQIASIWHGNYIAGLSTPTKLIQQNIYRHLAMMDDRYTIGNFRQTSTYFTCTYHAPEHARRVKGLMNKAIRKAGVPEIENNPDPNAEKKHIAIITNRWHRNHAVYKSAGPLVEQLIGKYRLSLIWTAPNIPDTIVKDYFESVDQCYFQPDGSLILPDALKTNDYDMVYFPDVGMSDESIWLSNTQIAPIQAVGYGHPDTTGDNNCMDYFICGDVEKDADHAYSETRVCLPGLAQEPAWPTAAKEDNYIDDDIVRINCVWGPDKYNHTLLSVLAEINNTVYSRTGKAPTHEFHLFGSPGMNRYAALPSFMHDVTAMLPNAHIHTEWEYYDYMREMQKHDFAMNSFPFGCYNVLIEALWAGLPFLTIVGDRFYNRAGMWLNDQVDMSENNFENPRKLIDHAADLILDPEKLKAQRAHLAGIDLKEKLFTLKGNHFLEAIEYIFENHPFTETKIIGENE